MCKHFKILLYMHIRTVVTVNKQLSNQLNLKKMTNLHAYNNKYIILYNMLEKQLPLPISSIIDPQLLPHISDQQSRIW